MSMEIPSLLPLEYHRLPRTHEEGPSEKEEEECPVSVTAPGILTRVRIQLMAGRIEGDPLPTPGRPLSTRQVGG